jgi:membrane protease YdiL (CAAX protease family)
LLSLLAYVAAYRGYVYVFTHMDNRSLLLGYGGLAVVTVVVYPVAARLIERRPVGELSLAPAIPELFAGVLSGIALFASVIASLWIAGVYQPQGWGSFDGSLGLALLFWLAIGVAEEIQFRGFVYRLCGTLFGTWGAILVSGIAFGLIHAMDPGATATALSSVALAGLFLGAVFALSGRLWVPIGFHTGWNFAEGSLFGTAVSGSNVGGSLVNAKLVGPEILTGGRFGPEASIATVVVLLVATIVLVWRIAASRRIEPPIWRARDDEQAQDGN